MAKEKQKMTLNVRRRATTVAVPPAIDPGQVEAFASGISQTNEIKPKEPQKQKVIRDAFTMPADDHGLFAEIQKTCLSIGINATKSEILRAGLKYLAGLDAKDLEKIIKTVPKIKTGRPSAVDTLKES